MMHRGFSLIELLISIAVVAVLLALSLSAVQSVREQSRLLSCRNNLRQVGVAIGSYEASFRIFPPAASSGSLHVLLLPYLDQEPLFKEFEAASESEEAYQTFGERRSAPSVYLCPSEAAPEYAAEGAYRLYSTSYAGNFGTGVQAYGYNGIFQRAKSSLQLYPQGYIGTADVLDGLTNTAAVSEILHGTGQRERQRTFWETPSQLAQPDELEAFAEVCIGIPPVPADYGWKGDPLHLGSPWTRGDVAYSMYNHVLPPNSPSCTNGGLWQFSIVSANSLHRSMVNVLYADGRVAGVSDVTDSKVWRDLGSRSNRVFIRSAASDLQL